TTYVLEADQPIPPNIELIAIVGPTRPLSLPLTAYLWDFLARGGHMLLAFDPNGHNGVSAERAASGLNQLLEREYGLRFADTFLIEPWFSARPLADVATSWTEAYADDLVPHPITQPLIDYNLPVRFWGGRSAIVEMVNGNARTFPLLYVDTPYGETGALDLRRDDPAQFTRNIGADDQGRLLIGAIAEHRTSGSRVALLGDSEILRNLFGQARIIGREDLPRFPGDTLLTERLVAWLMGVPLENWPALPAGFTRIAIDGETGDWPPDLRLYGGVVGAERQPGGATRAFYDDQYLYVTVMMPDDPTLLSEIVVELRFGEGDTGSLIRYRYGQVVNAALPDIPLADSAGAASTEVEMRLPLREVPPRIEQICIGVPTRIEITICTSEPVLATPVNTIAPVPVYIGGGPSAFSIDDMNVRIGPGLDFRALVLLRGRQPLRVLGRSADGNWIRVETARYSGWVFRSLVLLNVDVERLPVVE
ncbi:MAG: SH3 domain-containing protein, partial [Anaerolinea sp.]|nr:SH3 domain-containing protein [Anaerolinea sp.]